MFGSDGEVNGGGGSDSSGLCFVIGALVLASKDDVKDRAGVLLTWFGDARRGGVSPVVAISSPSFNSAAPTEAERFSETVLLRVEE